MKNKGPDTVSPEVLAQLERLAAMSDDDIDFSEAPEVTDWSGAVRGRFANTRKQTVSVSLDADLVEYVAQAGQGSLDDRLNTLLRNWASRLEQAAE